MSISGYAKFSVTRQFPLHQRLTIPCTSASLSACSNYVQPLYKTHWPITPNQTITKPMILASGDTVLCDPTISSGNFTLEYKSYSSHIQYLMAKNHAVNSKPYRVALLHRTSDLFLRELNYHPDSSQHFFHQQPRNPFLMLLAPPGPLDTTQISALIFNQEPGDPQGLAILPGVWHSPPIPLSTQTPQTLFTQQTRSHNCVLWDSLYSLGSWLHIHMIVR
jgi:ureidoglycolate hydrolase